MIKHTIHVGYIMFYGRLLLYFRIISEMVYNVHFLCYVLYNQVLLPLQKYAEWLYDMIEQHADWSE